MPLHFDQLPKPFRNQVILILDDMIGIERQRAGIGRSRVDRYAQDTPEKVWEVISIAIIREAGLQSLGHPMYSNHDQFAHYIRSNETSVPHLLEAIEIAFRTVLAVAKIIRSYQDDYVSHSTPKQGVDELNARFRQHALGYRFELEPRTIERVDSEYLYVESIAPGLTILRRLAFVGAEHEFLLAQEHLRHGRHEEAINEALKAYESTMKLICDARGWIYPSNPSSAQLVRTLIDQELFPAELEHYATSLRGLLESGLATVRNRSAGHGRGGELRRIPAHLAAFAIHLAAANIVFLAETHEEGA